jgi:hypothetical protein
MIFFLRPWTLTLVKGMNFIEDIEKYLNDIIWLRFVQNAHHLAYSPTFSQQIEPVVNKKYCHMQTKIFLRSNFTYQCILHKIRTFFCYFSSCSYSVSSGRSGIQDNQTSFIGCDHGEVRTDLNRANHE